MSDLARKCPVHQFAEMMDEEEMRFLRGGAARAGHDQLAGGEPFGFAAATAEEGDAFESEFLRLGERREDVGGITTRGEHHDEIPGLGQTRATTDQGGLRGANTWSNPKSLPMQVMSEPSEDNAIAGSARRLFW